MGIETTIKSSDPSESKPLEEIDPHEEPSKALDERDMLEPLNEARDEAEDQEQADESGSAGGTTDGEQKIRLNDFDGQVDSGAGHEEAEMALTLPDEPSKDQFELEDLTEQDSGRDDDSAEVAPEEIKNTAHKVVSSQSTSKIQKAKKTAKAFSAPQKVAVAALVVVIIAGLTIYSKPALIGLDSKVKAVLPVANESQQPVKPEQAKVQKSTAPGKHDLYLAKLEEADRFRAKLLEKKEAIYKLKLYYHNGIAELMDQVAWEIQETGISSYAQALENKHIELNLSTIQRRRVYI